jgi:replicative DNA helicase
MQSKDEAIQKYIKLKLPIIPIAVWFDEEKKKWQKNPPKGSSLSSLRESVLNNTIKWEEYGVGLITNEYKTVDCDRCIREDLDAETSKFIKQLEETGTRKFKTISGNFQYLFKSSNISLKSSQDVFSTKDKGYQVDIRGFNNYAVIPPTEGYEWLNKFPIKEIPQWLVDKLTPVESEINEVISDEQLQQAEIQMAKYPCYNSMYQNVKVLPGEHHHTAVRIIAFLRDHLFPESVIYGVLSKWDTINKSYLGNKEIRNLIYKQQNKKYLYNCKDELLLKYCSPDQCPLKQIDDKYIPMLDLVNSPELIDKIISKVPETAPEMPIRLNALNQKLWGLRRGELLVIAGFASYGKSAFINQMALDAINQKKTVLIFSSESSCEEVVNRLLANNYEIEGFHFRNGKFTDAERNALISAKSDIKQWKVFICDKSQPQPEDMEFAIRRIKPDVVFLDYLQRCVYGNNRYEQLNDWMISLKSFSKTYNIPVIVASQINRASKLEGQPSLHHLLGSGSIEQEGDIVLILDRTNKMVSPESTVIKGYLEKGRNIGTGKFEFVFNMKYLRFTEHKSSEQSEGAL